MADKCETRRCKKAAAVGHHRDYMMPYDVDWLCRGCHARVHMDNYGTREYKRHEIKGIKKKPTTVAYVAAWESVLGKGRY